MQQREWAYAHPEGNASGTTWAEIFVLFDTAAYRSKEAQHVKHKEALRRAVQRRNNAKEAKAKHKERKGGAGGRRDWDISNTSVISKPTYDQEIQLFKAIAREIARHELNDEQTKIFQM